MSDSEDDSEGRFFGYPEAEEASEEDSDESSEKSSDDEDEDEGMELPSADGIEGEVITKGAKKSGWDRGDHRGRNGRAVRSAVRQPAILL